MQLGSVLIGCFSLLLLAGCATPYQKEGFFTLMRGGYSDKEIAPGQYEIRVSGNESDKPEHLVSQWRRRAAELCNSTSFTESFEQSQKTESSVMPAGVGMFMLVSYQVPIVFGKVTCNKST